MAETTRAVVLSDTHAPLHDEAAFNCALKAIEIVKPYHLIHIGDIGEMAGSSHWQWKKKRRPPLEFQLPEIDKDIAACNVMLDRIDEVAKRSGVIRKYMIQGNHCVWIDNVVEANPFLRRTTHKYGSGYLFKDAMNLRHRHWRYFPIGQLLKIGHIRFYHGHLYSGVHHALNHLVKMGCNILYGHYHDCQQASITHVDGEKSAWCIGCLKRLDREANEFMSGRPSNWCHAFAVVDWWGKNFSVTVHRIIGGRAIVDGVKIDGNPE